MGSLIIVNTNSSQVILKNRVTAYLKKSRRPWDGPNGESFRKWIASGQHTKYIKNKRGKFFTAAEIEDATDIFRVDSSLDDKDIEHAGKQSEKNRDKEYWKEKNDSDEEDSPFDFEFLEDEMEILGIDSIDTWSDKLLSKIGL